MNLGKRADAQSSDTTFAGLPKYCRLSNSSAAGPAPAGWYGVTFDTIQDNFGGFTFTGPSTGVNQKIIIPEPGIYYLNFHFLFGGGAPAQSCFSGWALNAAASPTTGLPEDEHPTGGSFPNRGGSSGMAKLNQGDQVFPMIFGPAAGMILEAGHNMWVQIMKMGGQY